jgi:small GTP-binding protein
MGLALSSVWSLFAWPKEARLMMVGLDAAGKTTILRRLKFAEVAETVPTIGFNVETVQYGGLTMTVWDIGGQEQIRKLWRHYYSGTQAVIFVVDCADSARNKDARDELHNLMNALELRGVPLLVFANKQDLPSAMTKQSVVEGLELGSLPACQWLVQPSCATSGDGLYEGIDWLAKAVRRREREINAEGGPFIPPKQEQQSSSNASRPKKQQQQPSVAQKVIGPADGSTSLRRRSVAMEQGPWFPFA